MTVYRRIHPSNRLLRTVGIQQSVFMQEEVIMLPLTDKYHDIFQKLSIFLAALFARSFFGILLQSPYSPQQHIGMFHFINFVPHRFFIDEVTDCLFRRFHHIFKLIYLVNGKCQSRQSDEHIARPTFEPRITGKNIVFALLLIVELMSRVLQTVIETITRCTIGHFRFKCLFQPASRRF